MSSTFPSIGSEDMSELELLRKENKKLKDVRESLLLTFLLLPLLSLISSLFLSFLKQQKLRFADAEAKRVTQLEALVRLTFSPLLPHPHLHLFFPL